MEIIGNRDLYTKKEAAQDFMSQLTRGASSYTLRINDKTYTIHWVKDGSLAVNDSKTHGIFLATMTWVARFFLYNEQESLLTQLNSNLNAAAKHLKDSFSHPQSYFYSWNGYHQNTLENYNFRTYKKALSAILQGKLPKKYEPFASFIQDCITGNNPHFASAHLNLTGVLKNWKGLNHVTLTSQRINDWKVEIEKPWQCLQSKQKTSIKGLTIEVIQNCLSDSPDLEKVEEERQIRSLLPKHLCSFVKNNHIPPSFTLKGGNSHRSSMLLRDSDVFLDILTKKKLVALSLEGIQIGLFGETISASASALVANFLKGNPQLKKLSLIYLDLDSPSDSLPEVLANHPGLEELVLENNGLSQNIDTLFSAVLRMPNLKTLHFIQGNHLSSHELETFSKEGLKIEALETLHITCPITWFQTFGGHLHALKKLNLNCYNTPAQQDANNKNKSFVVQVDEVFKAHPLLTFFQVSSTESMLVSQNENGSSEMDHLMHSVQTHPHIQTFLFPNDWVPSDVMERHDFCSKWMNVLNGNTKLVSLGSVYMNLTDINNRLIRNKLLTDLDSPLHEETYALLMELCACLSDVPTELILLLVEHVINLETEEAFRTIEQYND